MLFIIDNMVSLLHMANFFGRIFSKSEKRALGVDIGSSSIKVVELYTDSGHVYLETYGSVALGPYADLEVGKATGLSVEKIQDALQKVMQESGCSAEKAAATIPFNASLVSVIRLPKVSENRLEQIIPIEARKYIPATLEEVVLDWSVIDARPDIPVDNKKVEEDGNGNESGEKADKGEEQDKDKKKEKKDDGVAQIDVLLAAIHNDSIERYEKILKGTSLEVSFYEIEVFSTLRALSIEENVPVAVIDIGSASSKVYIIEGGMMRASHTINRGSQDITIAIAKVMNISEEEAEMVKRAIGAGGSYIHLQEAVQNVLDHLFSEALRFINNYENKNSRAIERVTLSGGGATMKGLQNTAQEFLSKEVQVAKPFDVVKSLPFMKETLAKIGPEYTPAIGAALRAIGFEK